MESLGLSLGLDQHEAIYDSQTDSDEMVPGTHWFLAAWRVNPDQ